MANIRFEYPSSGSHNGSHKHSSSDACARIVEEAALDPAKAVLVVTGDFDTSVRDRLPAEMKAHWTSARGAGDVGAKTMVVGDEVHVLMHEYYFEPQPDPSFDYGQRNKMIERLARHESRHVTMEQAGEADGPTIDRKGQARRRFLHMADAVISEYRAELDVPLKYDMPFSRFDPEEVATWMRGALTQVATVDYQKHLDVERLAYSVAQVLEIAAKQLAPIAAHRALSGKAAGAAFEPIVTASVDWTEMVAATWADFEGALRDVPPSRDRVSPVQLAQRTQRLADVLDEWLQRLGFEWNDTDHSFLIKAWDLYT